MGCSRGSQTRSAALPKKTEAGSHLTPLGQALPWQGEAGTAEVAYLKTHHHPLKVLRSGGGRERSLEPGTRPPGSRAMLTSREGSRPRGDGGGSRDSPRAATACCPPSSQGGTLGVSAGAVTLLTHLHPGPPSLAQTPPPLIPRVCRHSPGKRTD